MRYITSFRTFLTCALSFSLACGQAQQHRVIDSETSRPVANCVIKTFGGSGQSGITLMTDTAGVFDVSETFRASGDSVLFSHPNYAQLTLGINDLPEEIRMHNRMISLGEVTVVGERPTVKLKLSGLDYDVTADPYLKNKSLWDALGRTPLLFTTRGGGVSTIPGYSGIEWKLNGLEEALFNSLFDMTSAVEANSVKRIEIRDKATEKGKVLVVNVVTKGRLEGYAGVAYSELADNQWDNSIYALTKVKRLTTSLRYANIWDYGHSSTNGGIEERNGGLFPVKEYCNWNHGYKRDLNRVEFSASYDLTNKTVISAYGTLWAPTNIHSEESGIGVVKSSLGDQLMKYNFIGGMKNPKSLEYNLVMSMQHKIKNGNILFKYNFYNMNRKFENFRSYNIECGEYYYPEYRNFFPDEEKLGAYNYLQHKFNFELNKSFAHGNKINIVANGRYLSDHTNKTDRYFYDDFSEIMNDRFRHRQAYGMFYVTYDKYFGESFSIQTQATAQIYHNRLDYKETKFDKNYFRIVPTVIIEWLTSRSTRLTMDYAIMHQVPNVSVLNPYRQYPTAGIVSYGNPDLKPETRHQMNLSIMIMPTNNALWRFTSANRYSKDLILQSTFLEDGLLNKTYFNAASCIENSVSAYFRSRTRRVRYSFFSSINYVNYNAYDIRGIGHGQNGWYWHNTATITYESPTGWVVEANGGADTRHVYFQGRGGSYYSYGLSVSKYMLRDKFILTVFCNDPFPIHQRQNYYYTADGYLSKSYRRNYSANFGISVRLRFGSLKARVKGDLNTISTSDVKTSY